MPGRLWNADPGVGGRPDSPHRLFARGHLDADRSGRGELDGIAQQVVQDLPAVRAASPPPTAALPGRCRLTASPWPAPHCPEGARPARPRVKVERRGLDLQSARLDARQIQNVIHPGQAAIAPHAGSAPPSAPTGRRRRSLQHVGQPEHGVQGAADLVAHVGRNSLLARLAASARVADSASLRSNSFRSAICPRPR